MLRRFCHGIAQWVPIGARCALLRSIESSNEQLRTVANLSFKSAPEESKYEILGVKTDETESWVYQVHIQNMAIKFSI